MILEEMLRDERAEGRAEGKAESIMVFLEELGTVPEMLCDRIMKEKDPQVLTRWLKLSAKAASVDEFLEKM